MSRGVYAVENKGIRTIGIPYGVMVGGGYLEGATAYERFGRNPDVTSLGTPEDIWNGGGEYTGFPVGDSVPVEVFSGEAGDTGELTVWGLKTPDSTELESETVTLTGTTPVALANSWWRINRQVYNNGSATAFNLGAITVRDSDTTSNVFSVIPVGFSHSTAAVFTVPADCTGYLTNISVNVSRQVTANITGALWYREFGKSPTMLRPFSASNEGEHVDIIPYGLTIPAKTDISLRVLTVSALSTVIGEMDLIVLSNEVYA